MTGASHEPSITDSIPIRAGRFDCRGSGVIGVGGFGEQGVLNELLRFRLAAWFARAAAVVLSASVLHLWRLPYLFLSRASASAVHRILPTIEHAKANRLQRQGD